MHWDLTNTQKAFCLSVFLFLDFRWPSWCYIFLARPQNVRRFGCEITEHRPGCGLYLLPSVYKPDWALCWFSMKICIEIGLTFDLLSILVLETLKNRSRITNRLLDFFSRNKYRHVNVINQIQKRGIGKSVN